MLLWGPPGCGKTTLARIIARRTQAEFVPFSAVLAGIKEIKEVMAKAEGTRRYGRRTIVFVDEVHRFNRAQQDAFLPHVEAGNILLIGATTENPSFEVIAPLLSRMKVYVLHALSQEQIVALLRKAIEDPERGLGKERVEASDEILDRIAVLANGDARSAYNTLEALVLGTEPGADGRRVLSEARLEDVLQKKLLPYDKAGEEHYNLISALHKSVRNSDPDAALYWLARMLESGEDPLYLARRMVRMASEDIGLAEPGALAVTIAAKEAFDFIGPPEGISGARAGGRLSVARAEIERALHRLRRGPRRFAADHRGARPAASKKCGHGTDGQPRLRQRLPIRARCGRESDGHDVPARKPRGARLLQADRPGIRGAHPAAAGRNSANQDKGEK